RVSTERRPRVCAVATTTSRPAKVSVNAACSMAAVFPTPGAMPRKTFSRPCLPPRSGTDAPVMVEPVVEGFSSVTCLVYLKLTGVTLFLWQGPAPFQRHLLEARGDFWIGGSDVLGLVAVSVEVIQLDVGTVGVDEQFPFAVPHGEIRAAIM